MVQSYETSLNISEYVKRNTHGVLIALTHCFRIIFHDVGFLVFNKPVVISSIGISNNVVQYHQALKLKQELFRYSVR